METTNLVLFLSLGLLAGLKNDTAVPASTDAQIQLNLLDSDQILLHSWTEDRFGDLLHRDYVQRFSEGTRKVLAQRSLDVLKEAVGRKWDGYGWHDEKFTYKSFDYETW